MIANAARVGVLLVGVLVLDAVDGHSFVVLAGVALAFGVADAVHNPAAGTMAPQMVRPDDLRPLMACSRPSAASPGWPAPRSVAC